MTNYERIKSMSIDEMADYLIDCCNCPNDMFLCGSKGSVGEKHIKHWLESEVETKMTDNEIFETEIKCINRRANGKCNGGTDCCKCDLLMNEKDIISAYERAIANNDLINRQQAEIEKLKAEEEKYPFKCVMPFSSMICSKSIEDYDCLINDIGVDAIKGFADRLKERQVRICDCFEGVSIMDIDKLVNKMVGEE